MAGYKIKNQYHTHFLTCTVVGWADVFTRPIYKSIVMDSLGYCQQEKGLIIYAYVIMSNHLHLIAAASEGSKGLSAIIGDFKKYTAKQIIQTVKSQPESRREWLLNLFAYHAKYNTNNQTYQVWIQDNRPMELVSRKWLLQKLNYIHQNPVRSKLVNDPVHYVYSSAANYVGQEGALPVTVMDLGMLEGYVFLGC